MRRSTEEAQERRISNNTQKQSDAREHRKLKDKEATNKEAMRRSTEEAPERRISDKTQK
jgi:hypothetical protein